MKGEHNQDADWSWVDFWNGQDRSVTTTTTTTAPTAAISVRSYHLFRWLLFFKAFDPLPVIRVCTPRSCPDRTATQQHSIVSPLFRFLFSAWFSLWAAEKSGKMNPMAKHAFFGYKIVERTIRRRDMELHNDTGAIPIAPT